MSTIHDAHFDFDRNISGELATAISRRTLEILRERLDDLPGRPASIRDLEIAAIALPPGELDTEETAHQIAAALYSSVAERTRGSRG